MSYPHLRPCMPLGRLWGLAPVAAALMLSGGCSGPSTALRANPTMVVVDGPAPDSIGGLTARCDEGEASACSMLAERYEEGWTVELNERRAMALYERACDAGFHDGCARLGVMLAAGLPALQDRPRGFELAGRACAGGSALGCGIRGWMLVYGHGTEADPATGLRKLKQACDKDTSLACHLLGGVLDDGPIYWPRNAARAHDLFRRACGSGFRHACESLGSHYELGVATARDPSEALRLFEKSCALGSARGCTRAASLLLSTTRDLDDAKRARAHLTQACRRGVRFACTRLAVLEHERPGLAGNVAKLAAHHQQRCQALDGKTFSCTIDALNEVVVAYFDEQSGERHDTPASCKRLGAQHCFEMGNTWHHGTHRHPRNAHRALELWRTACELGESDGCIRWAQATEAGYATSASRDGALKIYADTCNGGAAEACSIVDWRRGAPASQRTIDLRLSVATEATCAMRRPVKELFCPHREPPEEPSGPAPAKAHDNAKVLLPVTTANRQQLLVAGLWHTPALRQARRANGDAAEAFLRVRCRVTGLGRTENAAVQWSPDTAWLHANRWQVARALRCDVLASN